MGLRTLLSGAALVSGAAAAAVEARFRRHPGNDLRIEDAGWAATRTAPDTLVLAGELVVHNDIVDREVMLSDVRATVHLLGDTALDEVTVRTRARSLRKDYPARDDGYWVAYVVKPAKYHSPSPLRIEAEVHGPAAVLDALGAARIEVTLDTYGFEGPRLRHHHVVLALRHPDPTVELPWRDAADGRARVRPVRTHLLGPFDNPVEIVRRYAAPHARPGDIVTLGETPVAVMQGRFHDPRNLKLGWAATRSAQFMSGEGSLGTAAGMRALMLEHGTLRVMAAMAAGVVAKAAGRPGWFYRLAGPQARLVDDVTGTLPPYDKLIVIGPDRADDLCRRITTETGLLAAVVDANDLGKVDVVGASAGLDHALVCAALRANPAGNADESTPIVPIRPAGPGEA